MTGVNGEVKHDKLDLDTEQIMEALILIAEAVRMTNEKLDRLIEAIQLGTRAA